MGMSDGGDELGEGRWWRRCALLRSRSPAAAEATKTRRSRTLQPPRAPSPRPSSRPRPTTTTEATKPEKPKKPAKPETLRLVEDGNPTVFVKLKETVDLYDEPDGKVVETVGHFTAVRLAHCLRRHRPEGRLGRRPHARTPRTASRSGSSSIRSASRRVARSGTSRWICPSSRRASTRTASWSGPSPSRSGCRRRRRRPAASRSRTPSAAA